MKLCRHVGPEFTTSFSRCARRSSCHAVPFHRVSSSEDLRNATQVHGRSTFQASSPVQLYPPLPSSTARLASPCSCLPSLSSSIPLSRSLSPPPASRSSRHAAVSLLRVARGQLGEACAVLLHGRAVDGRIELEQRELRSRRLAHREAVNQLLLHPQQRNRFVV